MAGDVEVNGGKEKRTVDSYIILLFWADCK